MATRGKRADLPIMKEGDVLDRPQIQALASALQAAGPRLGFSCAPWGCICTGDADCNDMFSTNSCGPRAVCFTDAANNVVCVCVR
jgi:hypothetical protein